METKVQNTSAAPISEDDEALMRALDALTAEIKAAESKEATQKQEQKNEKSIDDIRKNGRIGHRERLKDRFLAAGANALAPHEMLELLLFYADPRRDTKPVAYELLNRFGDIAGVFDADIGELMKVKGVTKHTAVLFKLIPAFQPMYYDRSGETDRTNNGSAFELDELFKPYFVGESSEKLMLACFDPDLRLIKVTEVSRGNSVYTPVDIRKIVQEVVNDSALIALAHNHPGGACRPSDDDISMTRRLVMLLKNINIRLMDHLIVGDKRVYSMRSSGDLNMFD